MLNGFHFLAPSNLNMKTIIKLLLLLPVLMVGGNLGKNKSLIKFSKEKPSDDLFLALCVFPLEPLIRYYFFTTTNPLIYIFIHTYTYIHGVTNKSSCFGGETKKYLPPLPSTTTPTPTSHISPPYSSSDSAGRSDTEDVETWKRSINMNKRNSPRSAVNKCSRIKCHQLLRILDRKITRRLFNAGLGLLVHMCIWCLFPVSSLL